MNRPLDRTVRTFEDWWATRTQDGTENKDLARDAWFAAMAVMYHYMERAEVARRASDAD